MGKPVKTRGEYDPVRKTLSYKYKVCSAPTNRKDNSHDLAVDAACPIRGEVLATLQLKDHDLQRTCSDPSVDLFVLAEAVLEKDDEKFFDDGPYYAGDIHYSYKNVVFVCFTVDLQTPFDGKGLISTISAENWPISLLLPESAGVASPDLCTPREALEDSDIADGWKTLSEQAVHAVQEKAKALHDYVSESFNQKETRSLMDRVKQPDLDHHLTQHIRNLRVAMNALHAADAKALCEDFIATSTSAFWLGRAWHASEDAAKAESKKNNKKRITAYCRMRDHLRSAWGAVTPDIEDLPLPMIMSNAEAMPAAVMRAVRARYTASWRAQEATDVIGGYVAGTVGIKTSLDQLAGAAKAAFAAAVARENQDLTQRLAPAARRRALDMRA